MGDVHHVPDTVRSTRLPLPSPRDYCYYPHVLEGKFLAWAFSVPGP